MRRLALVAVLLTGCGGEAERMPTGTVCPDPDPGTPTYASFGRDFMARYCTWCHASDLPRSQRNGAPIYHDYDSLLGVLQTPDHVEQEAGAGPDATNRLMPPDRCPSVAGGPLDRDCAKPTDDERRELALWIACERNRPHDFSPDAALAEPDAGL